MVVNMMCSYPMATWGGLGVASVKVAKQQVVEMIASWGGLGVAGVEVPKNKWSR